MKRVAKFFLISSIITVSLCGCSADTTENTVGTSDTGTSLALYEEAQETADLKNLPEQDVEDREKIELCTLEETIEVEWDGVHIQSKVFATVGNKIYFCEWGKGERESALYRMEIGRAELQKVDMDIPEGMDICAMTSDKMGNLHLLLRTRTKEGEEVISVIRKLNTEENIDKEIDISQALQGKLLITQAFLVDGGGNYYVKGMAGTMCISGDGLCLWEVKDSTLGIGRSFAATVDANGDVYMTYQKNDVSYIGKVNPQNGTIMDEYPLPEIEISDSVLALGQGVDSDLLIYGGMSGCWTWNKASNQLEMCVSMSESELPFNANIVIRAFLEDGRLLLVKNISEGEEPVERTFEYIPVEK